MKLIIGLGNPGKTYAHNRHNIGFRCLNHLAKIHSIQVKKHQCQAQVGVGRIDGIEVLLAKPKTFVNLSGNAVSSLMRKYKIPVSDLIVIYDDLDLPLGKVRIRPEGSAGGHKGMKSIISALGSNEFCRIKVGIGRPKDSAGKPLNNEDVIVSYVLSDFIPQEDRTIKSAIDTVAEAIDCILTEGVVAGMNKFN